MDIIRGDGTLLNEIDLAPQNVYQEVLQNVAMILDTIQKSAPMKRGMGMAGDLLHSPLPVLENLMVARISALARLFFVLYTYPISAAVFCTSVIVSCEKCMSVRPLRIMDTADCET